MSRKAVNCALLCGGALICAAIPYSAYAQSEPAASQSDIIVTAQRRAEPLENVPMSVVALGSEAIEKAGVVSVRDIGQIAAGVQINQAGAATQPAIRGVSTVLNTFGYENNVAIYVDGFYQPDFITINADLANIAGVQVLKGPQGTLYGRNATGGAILINTLAPSATFTGKVQATYGSFNERSVSAYISGPISDKIRFGVAGYWRKNDNYIKLLKPIPAGPQNPSKFAPIEQQSVRAKLEADLTDNLTATVGFNYGLVSDPRGYIFTPIAHSNPATIIPGLIPSTQRYRKAYNYGINPDAKTYEGTLKLEWKTDIGTLTSYTAYGLRKVNQDFDIDGSYVDAQYAINRQRSDSFQQTFDYLIDAVDHLTVIAGASYYKDHSRVVPPISTSVYGPGLVRTVLLSTGIKSDAMAFYVDGTLDLSDTLSLTAGARYSVEKKTYTLEGLQGLVVPRTSRSASFAKVTPRASLRWELAPRTNIYASYSKGFRSGTINQGTSILSIMPVRQEIIDAYEIGFKTVQGPFRFNLAGFYYDYKDLQVSLTRNICVDAACNNFVVFGLVSNAPKAEIYGLDGEVSFNPTSRLTIRAAGAYLHARYKDFTNATGTALNPTTDRNFTEVQDWSGQQLPRAPSFSGNIGADYTLDLLGGRLDLSANVNYTDSFVIQNPSLFGSMMGALANKQRYRQRGYTLVNAQVTWTDPSDHFYVGVYGRNLTDKYYQMLYNGNAGVGDYSTPAPPREFGAKVGYKF
ncbi:TonB-dependent receptor [Sphingobium tyrosinilyticum]|uniref:TonB-dependent receptor n=1 Tax=Sphingobium tyrosinilyticum TaxID=2715436 RepID=A0ABV9F6N4_9SPHN